MTHRKDFQEISDFAVLGVDSGSNSFQIGNTLHKLSEVVLECGMIYEILDSIESSIDRRYILERHTKPDTEQPLPWM